MNPSLSFSLFSGNLQGILTLLWAVPALITLQATVFIDISTPQEQYPEFLTGNYQGIIDSITTAGCGVVSIHLPHVCSLPNHNAALILIQPFS